MNFLARAALGCLGLVVVYFALSFLFFGVLEEHLNPGVASWIVFVILVVACFIAVRFVNGGRR